MNLNDILDQWDIDCVINDNQLGDASLQAAKLHSKYLRHLLEAKGRKTKVEAEYQTLRKAKFRYYRGEMPRTELVNRGWEPYQYTKPLKNEMEEILKGDEDLTKLQMKMDYVDTTVYALESIMNQIKARDWQIKNAIEFKKFLAGN